MWRQGSKKWHERQRTNCQLGLFDYPFADTNRKCLTTERDCALNAAALLSVTISKICMLIAWYACYHRLSCNRNTSIEDPTCSDAYSACSHFPFKLVCLGYIMSCMYPAPCNAPQPRLGLHSEIRKQVPFILITTLQSDNHTKCKTTAVYSSHPPIKMTYIKVQEVRHSRQSQVKQINRPPALKLQPRIPLSRAS